MATLIRRISERDGHILKRPTKTTLWKKLRENQIENSPRLKPFEKENIGYNSAWMLIECHVKKQQNGMKTKTH